MWNSSNQYSAFATRKFRTCEWPKSKTSVPQSCCSPRRGSVCSYSGWPSNCASAKASFGKCAGTQSTMTPMPARCSESMRNLRSSGDPKRDVGA